LKPDDITAKAHEYIRLEHHDFFRNQVEKLLAGGDQAELTDRFFTDLEFGTGGLRGVIGGGYNRMNPFTVQRATQGLANYINKMVGPGKGSAVIAYDSRNFSDLFAREAAGVLCGNGITTWLFTGLRPTPELSFAVRKLGATAGIVVTASHNPPEYNGYKVYWSDGAQVVPPHDDAIIAEVRAVTEVRSIDSAEAETRGLLRRIDREVDDDFIAMVKNCSLRPGILRDNGRDFKVVFTPLHGTGAMPVERALREMGVNVIFVPEQKDPDGNFPTVKYPNPEEASALKLALDLAAKERADLVMGTDPDADRLGIAAPDGGEFRLITGNQLGALLADYLLGSRAELGTMPPRPVFVKTIVTTELQRLIAKSYGCDCLDTLTGFKYIGEKIREFEQQNNGPSYVGGGEESYGYLVNTDVRDKDAVSAATMTVELTLYHRLAGRTLFDRLRELWFKFGYFEETQISKAFKGQAGLQTMKALMDRFRATPPATFAGSRVTEVKDYLTGSTLRFPSGSTKKDIDLPSSNVLQFILDDQTVITARPSGTEPKIKFYASCRSLPGIPLEQARAEVKSKIEAITRAINESIGGA
jgi:phosphoglucomutase